VLQNNLTINVIALSITWLMVSFDCIAEEPVQVAPKPIASAFASTTIQLKVPPHAATILAEWTYTNRWDFPLYIERIDHSCSCLNSIEDTKEATSIAPGETGRIRANFVPGSYRGLLRKSIHVHFVGHSGSVELVAEAQIPKAVELSQHELRWNADDQKTTTIDVTTGNDTRCGDAITRFFHIF
jgi:hypothetical protein